MIRRNINGIDISLQHDKFMKQLSLSFFNGSGLTRVTLIVMGKTITIRIVRQYRYLNRSVLEDKTISYNDNEERILKQLNKGFDILASRLAVKKRMG